MRDPFLFISKRNERQMPRIRSLASRCSEAARSLGLSARTLSYKGNTSCFLYNGSEQVFQCEGWKELLEELIARGAPVPADHWEVENNINEEV